jgi:hypothetical protein
MRLCKHDAQSSMGYNSLVIAVLRQMVSLLIEETTEYAFDRS